MVYKVIDLFSGAGGLSEGFKLAGFEIELAIDMWDDAIKTFNHNHKNKVAECRDIHDISDEYLYSLQGKITGVIVGPPCQGYSTVGTRNVNDPRNHLYLEYCRVVEKIAPKFFVIENVRGLLTLGKGVFKKDIIDRFSKLGYTVSYKLMNASDYGVPQNLYRVFFIGIKDNVFEFPEEFPYKVSCKEALSDLPSLDIYDLFSDIYRS